jgi:hypothetical protein
MDEHVLEPGLDLMPSQCVMAEIGDRPLQRRSIAAGDVNGSPEDGGRFDA